MNSNHTFTNLSENGVRTERTFLHFPVSRRTWPVREFRGNLSHSVLPIPHHLTPRFPSITATPHLAHRLLCFEHRRRRLRLRLQRRIRHGLPLPAEPLPNGKVEIWIGVRAWWRRGHTDRRVADRHEKRILEFYREERCSVHNKKKRKKKKRNYRKKQIEIWIGKRRGRRDGVNGLWPLWPKEECDVKSRVCVVGWCDRWFLTFMNMKA